MVDISNAKFIPNTFGGSEKKKTILYNDRVYMVKFPDPIRQLNNDLSYMNNAYSEDIGCRILKTIGFEVQNTFLATYKENNSPPKIVVACEDFTQDGARLSEFSKLLLSDVENTRSNVKKSCSIETVMDYLENDKLLSSHTEIRDRFWELMVADTLIGNQDRHLDNWGVLFENDSVRFAPIYDCGSSLSALVSDSVMQEIMEDESDFRDMEYNISSPYSYCGKRIFCASFFQKPPEQLARAVKKIVPKIDLSKIEDIISNTEGLSDIRKEYLTRSIKYRNKNILQKCYNKILKNEIKNERHGFCR